MNSSFETSHGTIVLVNRNQATHDGRGYRSKPRMYVGGCDGWSRAVKNTVRSIIDESGVPLDLTGARWSQFAGCSCPCSPGLILKYQGLTIGEVIYTHYDVYVTIKDAPTIEPALPSRVLVGV